MKKLILLLVAVTLITGLLAGCGIVPESRLWRIEAEPLDFYGLPVGDTLQLEVTAFYDDGTSANVTSECGYTTSAEAYTEVFATVSDGGLITAIRAGNADILVNYTQRRFLSSDITRTTEVRVKVVE